MKTFFILPLFLWISCACAAQPIQKDNLIAISFLTYSLPDFDRTPIEQAVARKWGFTFYTIGDCLVNQSLIDSVCKVNDAADKKMMARYGSNWRSRYEEEVDMLYATPERAQLLVNQQLYIWQKEQELKSSNDSLRFAWSNTAKPGVYEVVVSGSVKNTIFYKLLVEYPKYKVSLLTP
ncbi:hypothetical protein [Chitinophaga arvensicola]|uniref:Uncharacterized protein n=1 Tax=Chitinophaga arvensicola TaxID=29529 RepID=A0A1I0S5M8_9BACT|nr:hypothetical protein [Chitinophaga arvensicola]SEW50451.1 hypothetical protein SAMN04488122_3818 [Chitinophaga arvensicola]